jgi:hypothetical protein
VIGWSGPARSGVAKPSAARATTTVARSVVPTARNGRTCGPGAVIWIEARPGATIHPAIVALGRTWTEARAQTLVRAVDQGRAWAGVREAEVVSVPAAVNVAAAEDAKSVAAISAQSKGLRCKAEPFCEMGRAAQASGRAM